MLWARQSVPAKEKAQRQIKAELLLDGVALLGVDALGPGDGELAFGLDFLVSEATRRGLPYVSANLASRDGSLVFPASRVVTRGELKIGVTSVLSDQLHVAGGRVLPAQSSLNSAVAKLRADEQVDLVVVLSHLGLLVIKTGAKLTMITGMKLIKVLRNTGMDMNGLKNGMIPGLLVIKTGDRNGPMIIIRVMEIMVTGRLNQISAYLLNGDYQITPAQKLVSCHRRQE